MRWVGRTAVSVGLVAIAIGGCSQQQSNDGSASGGEAGAPAMTAEDEGYDLDALLAQADVARGKTLFLQCRACHSLGEGQAHKVGPNLFGMFGREAGFAPGFAYSEALTSSEIVWTAETMDEWLARPSVFLPGNRMVFVGVKKPQDRANLIAFLKQQTGDGAN